MVIRGRKRAGFLAKSLIRMHPVSYTHLDVYKRQQLGIDLDGPVAPLLADALAVADRPALIEALERMEDAVVQLSLIHI